MAFSQDSLGRGLYSTSAGFSKGFQPQDSLHKNDKNWTTLKRKKIDKYVIKSRESFQNTRLRGTYII